MLTVTFRVTVEVLTFNSSDNVVIVPHQHCVAFTGHVIFALLRPHMYQLNCSTDLLPKTKMR